MAASGLLTLLDDIASIMDDVAVLSKVAAKKTSGVLGDDLALNAQQVTGASADRELPIVWRVALGSLVNKLILIPAALLLSAFLPFLILPVLFLGGSYLCYEGFEKVWEKLFHRQVAESTKRPALTEQQKITGAIRTDFILSLEVIVITLGSVAQTTLMTQFLVLSVVGIAMTVGVYGIVAGIVKLDDAAMWLQKRQLALFRRSGDLLLSFAALLMRFLGIAGTAAMFLVGGGIVTHAIPVVHHISQEAGNFSFIIDGVAGVVWGGCLLLVVLAGRFWRRRWQS